MKVQNYRKGKYRTNDSYRFDSFVMLPLSPKETGLKKTVYVSGTDEDSPIPKEEQYLKYGSSLENAINIWFYKGFHIDARDLREKGISDKELDEVLNWITLNVNPLRDLYLGKIDHGDFIESFKSLSGDFVSLSMPMLLPRRTGLQKGIWLDINASNRNLGHNIYRVKYGELNAGISVTFYDKDNYSVIGNSKEISNNEIKQVKDWITRNYDLLVALYNGEIGFNVFLQQHQKI